MKTRKVLAIFMTAIMLIALTCNAYATPDPNIDGGGGGGGGTGTASNMWAVRGANGNLIYDGEGLRIYLVSGATGAPISRAVDITNANVSETNMFNGKGKTKHDYRFNDSALIPKEGYDKKLITAPATKLPQIIPWNEGSSTARINAIKNWFREKSNADWCLAQLGSNTDEARSNGYKLAIEPVAYFRYKGFDYAMTATEAALLNQMEPAGNNLHAFMAPLTHKNLPLSIFLENSEFGVSGTPVYAWTGSRTSNAEDADIINQLGIGYISFAPSGEAIPEGDLDAQGGNHVRPQPMGEGVFERFDNEPYTYPTDTWVVTPFRLCNVQRNGDVWSGGQPITSMRPAEAVITVGGITSVTIPNIYIPSGSEQLIWVKWRTPSAAQTIYITATASNGLFHNPQSSRDSDRYISTGYITANIVDAFQEATPPDPTINDTGDSIGFSESQAAENKNRILSSGVASNSWLVWDCDYFLQSITSSSNTSSSSYRYPPDDEYDAETGLYYRYSVTNTWSTRVPIDEERYYTRYTVQYDIFTYNYSFSGISYNARLGNANLVISPSEHVPTSFVRNFQTVMKSGYGINAETETPLSVTIDGVASTYYDPLSTTFASAPQYVVSYFPEFNYKTYNRFLEKTPHTWRFKQNNYSAYLDRSHFTPWWFPDNQNYIIVTRIDFAYTPAGRLYMGVESSGILIEGNLYDDWRVSPVRPG